MAAALMLMIVGGIFVTSWVTLMSTRASQVSYLEDVCRRRIGVESSRLLAWQCITSKAFDPNNTLPASQNTILGSDIGGINTHNGWNSLNVYTSSSTAGGMSTVFPYNHTGLRPGATYINVEQFTRPATGLAGNIDDYNAWEFLKTMPPVLNGDVFCIYRKPEGARTQLDVYDASNGSQNANWTVMGRTVLHAPDSLFVESTPRPLQLPFLTKSLYIQFQSTWEPPSVQNPVYGTDLNGKALLPSNMPVVPTTTGPVDNSGTSSFLGYLDVVRNDNNPDNSLWHFQDREAAAGRTPTVTIESPSVFNSGTEAYWISEQKTPTYPPPGWQNYGIDKWKVLFIKMDSQYLKNMRIFGGVDQIIFVGQSNAAAFANAGYLKPVIITIMPSLDGGVWRNVKDIRFERENNRRHVLAFKNVMPMNVQPFTIDFTWVSNPISGAEFRWRGVLVNEYTSLFFNVPSNLTQSVRWIGGVMTNWTVKRRAAGGINPSRLLFTSDSDPAVPAGTNNGPPFATFLPRDAWLESYFLPVAPP